MSNIVPVKQAPLVGLAGYGGGVPGLFYVGAAGTSTANITKSLRFNSADTAYLSRTPSSAGNRRTWTVSFWIKKVKNDSSANFYRIFGQAEATHIYFYQDNINFDISTTGNAIGRRWTNHVFRDNSAWFHCVCVCDTTASTASERMRMYINGSEVTSFSATTDPSQNVETSMNTTNVHTIGYRTSAQNNAGGALDAYIADFYFIDGSALDPTSFGEFNADGVWQAKAASGLTFGTNGFHLLDFPNESTVGHDSSGNNNDFTANNITTGNTFSTNMTPSSTAYPNTTLSNGGLSWSGSTSNNTGTVSSLTIPTNKKTYVEVTHTTTGGGNPGPGVGRGPTVELGLDSVKAWWRGGTDGSATGSTLGSFTGTNTSWSNGDVLGIALDHTANSGSGSITFYKNGYQIHTGGSGWTSYTDLRFEWQNNGSGTSSGTWNYGASAFSYPVSGHTGLFEEAGANEDVLFDVPVNGTQSDTGAGGEVSGNYATFNPLNVTGSGLSNGNLDLNGSSNFIQSTIMVDSGKYYFEFTKNGNGDNQFGIAYGGSSAGSTGFRRVWRDNNGSPVWLTDGANAGSGTALSCAVGDVIGVALDMDNNAVYFSKNGTYMNSGNPTSGSSKTGAIWTDLSGQSWGPNAGSNANGVNCSLNTGARAFAYSAPSGFKALCTTNLPTPTIADGSDYFDTLLYTGTGANQSISGLGFGSAPDLVWIKRRNGAGQHVWTDSVRGTNKQLFSSLTNAEQTSTTGITSFNSNGFSLGTNVSPTGSTNGSGSTYAAWCWDAGSSTVSNSDGSITSSVRASATSGFSIVSYTGSGTSNDSVGHGLNAAPELIITKNRDNSTYSWRVFTTAIDGSLDRLFLDATTTKADQTGVNVPTSSVFYVGSNLDHNKSGDNIIAYCFAPVAGYSAIGSYEGNGSSDGPFVHTGFRPAFLMWKNADGSFNWGIIDSKRDEINYMSRTLNPNTSDSQSSRSTNDAFDFLSNGFKVRAGGSNARNQNGSTFIWAAFAENPFQANGGLAR